MNPAMYIFANQGLGMSPGKLAAQVAHAAVEAYRVSVGEGKYASESHQKLIEEWYKGGHYTKLVMLARDTEHLLSIERYLTERGFKSKLIIDEGRTEIASHSPTALGVEIVDRDDPHTAASFESFKTYREEKPKPALKKKRLFG